MDEILALASIIIIVGCFVLFLIHLVFFFDWKVLSKETKADNMQDVREGSDADEVFEKLNNEFKPFEKIKVIEDLFIDCAKFSYKNLFEQNNAKIAILFMLERIYI